MLDLQPLRVEASHRCFYRIVTKDNSLVLMDSPPQLERNDQFVALVEVFAEAQVPVPHIIASDPQAGLFLITDLGDTHLQACYGTDLQETALCAAIDMLPRIAQARDPAIAPYTPDRLNMELQIFGEWFAGEFIKHPLDSAVFSHSSGLLIEQAEMQPKGCVHRDYHCRNILYHEGQLGIVDFQDALHGPILYDIASLLRDCYYTFTEAEVDQGLARFVSQTPALEATQPETIKKWFDWIAIQRQLKAIGIFARLHLRDGKSTHLVHIMPLLQRLQTLTAEYAELEPLNVQLNNCTKSAVAKLNMLI